MTVCCDVVTVDKQRIQWSASCVVVKVDVATERQKPDMADEASVRQGKGFPAGAWLCRQSCSITRTSFVVLVCEFEMCHQVVVQPVK